ncbi:MAG: hypothetical protein JSV88_14620 [Candidatus Aminicenantes bacterium]|nr:MAG: hypothetical protein JSV88_14620 [Candidatus Aminicenantes bacterium]
MKKGEFVLQGFQGSAKRRPLRTFTLTLFFLFLFIVPNKFTMKGGENTEHANSPQKLVQKHIATKLLTLLKKIRGT